MVRRGTCQLILRSVVFLQARRRGHLYPFSLIRRAQDALLPRSASRNFCARAAAISQALRIRPALRTRP